MQKSILISIQPQHVFNILTGKKTLELRKSVPKDFKGWVYIYCTKSKPYLHMTQHDILEKYPNTEDFILNDDAMITGFDILNGQVVARFWFSKSAKYYLEKPNDHEVSYIDVNGQLTYSKSIKDFLLEKSNQSFKEVFDYGKKRFDNKQSVVFAWHIKKLEVFNEPNKISDYQVFYDGEESFYQLKKAPQSWMYVYTNEQLS